MFLPTQFFSKTDCPQLGFRQETRFPRACRWISGSQNPNPTLPNPNYIPKAQIRCPPYVVCKYRASTAWFLFWPELLPPPNCLIQDSQPVYPGLPPQLCPPNPDKAPPHVFVKPSLHGSVFAFLTHVP